MSGGASDERSFEGQKFDMSTYSDIAFFHLKQPEMDGFDEMLNETAAALARTDLIGLSALQSNAPEPDSL